MHIVLIEPEIPGNTGNIARLCAANKITLHLVKPLGFSIDDKAVKRAGLDYWHLLDLKVYENFDEVLKSYQKNRFFYCTTKADKIYSDVKYQSEDFLVFGKETKGIPKSILKMNEKNCIRIPMVDEARSLNLANSVAITAYEVLRQLDFPNLQQEGLGINNL